MVNIAVTLPSAILPQNVAPNPLEEEGLLYTNDLPSLPAYAISETAVELRLNVEDSNLRSAQYIESVAVTVIVPSAVTVSLSKTRVNVPLYVPAAAVAGFPDGAVASLSSPHEANILQTVSIAKSEYITFFIFLLF